jgi:hypothetical protein
MNANYFNRKKRNEYVRKVIRNFVFQLNIDVILIDQVN